eukprot:CAMPEP_0173386376 /NCGR_PEP_ID=MMETSP1356-20130122/8978_1 /TAXON_ID=77927 ORGANISM="Hemiselmis virescens, Strain PCC157" /NCGR_SAMPLE_ID=MMETSP1356 /ASSEMBLY_ACC=CAM_ASM_000847 /LENGTH=41 /DNA_ID= /DNA_START= /DNA_END= /DNA_ORIENTATION=
MFGIKKAAPVNRPVVLLAGVPDPITGKKMHSTLWYLQNSPA